MSSPELEQYTPDAERVRLALEALWEIESLAHVIGERAEEGCASELWVRGVASRLCGLARVGMTALNDEMPGALVEAERLLRPWASTKAVQ